MEDEPPNLGYFLFGVVFLITPFTISISVLVLFLLLISSALVSGSEVAYFSLNANDLDTLKNDNSKKARRILRLRQKPRSLLATILICNNLINIAIVIISDHLLSAILPEKLFLNWSNLILNADSYLKPVALAGGIEFLIKVVGVTFLLVLFGEVAPKIYAKLNNIRLAKFMSPPIELLLSLFWPFSIILVKWSNGIEKRLKKMQGANSNLEDIDSAIELTMLSSDSHQDEVDMLKSILKFNELTVKQIMKSRVDVISIELTTQFSEILEIINDSGYSRIPVYEEDLDSIVGILYVKDLLQGVNSPDQFKWQELIRKDIMYVPEAKKINELLKDFQLERMHMAIVVDEFGGSAGIVTLEDIMEEVVGEIKDEFDQDEQVEYVKLDDKNYLFEGKTMLTDVTRIINQNSGIFDDFKGEADSLAGLFLEVTGKIPRKHQEITMHQTKLKVMSVSKRRVERIQLTLL